MSDAAYRRKLGKVASQARILAVWIEDWLKGSSLPPPGEILFRGLLEAVKDAEREKGSKR